MLLSFSFVVAALRVGFNAVSLKTYAKSSKFAVHTLKTHAQRATNLATDMVMGKGVNKCAQITNK